MENHWLVGTKLCIYMSSEWLICMIITFTHSLVHSLVNGMNKKYSNSESMYH